MNEFIIIFLIVILGINVVGIIFGFKLRDYMRKRRMRDMGESERKQWQQFEKYRLSRGGNWKVMVFIVSFMLVFITATIVLGSMRKVFLLIAILFIPLLLVQARSVFKTRNKDQVILLIFSLFMCVGYGLYGLEIIHNFDIIWAPFIIFIFWWSIFKMKTEQEAVNLFCNLVVTTGIEIDSQLNGYSQRPYSRESEVIKNKLKNLDFREITEKFAREAGKELIFRDWKIDDGTAIFYPTGNSFIFTEIYSIFSSIRKSKPSSIKLNDTGGITVFVSKNDYDKLLEPVTYHILCQNISEKFEQSFIEFAKGSEENKINAVKILRGEANG
jgi:hypothetical protein